MHFQKLKFVRFNNPNNIAALEHFAQKEKRHSRSRAIVLIHPDNRPVLEKHLDIVLPVDGHTFHQRSP